MTRLAVMAAALAPIAAAPAKVDFQSGGDFAALRQSGRAVPAAGLRAGQRAGTSGRRRGSGRALASSATKAANSLAMAGCL